MTNPVFYALEAEHVLDIERQDSQLTWLGEPIEIDYATAQLVAEQPQAFSAWSAGRMIGCFGISETFPGQQGVAWALLADGLGADHLAMTRFIRQQVTQSPLKRIEVIARGTQVDPALLEQMSAVQRLRAVMSRPSPECRWAGLLGFEAVHVLRRYGAADETYVLFERIASPDPIPAQDPRIANRQEAR